MTAVKAVTAVLRIPSSDSVLCRRKGAKSEIQIKVRKDNLKNQNQISF